MRARYLFRGQCVDTGEWYTGHLSRGRHDSEIKRELRPCIDYEEVGVMRYCIVNPETIGQCTGQKDKNGKLIFEGDLLHWEPSKEEIAAYPHVYEGCSFDEPPAPVKWRIGGWVADCGDDYVCLDDGEALRWTVVGNVHDNPELLEGVKPC